MATLSIPKNYADGTVLFESDLDDIKDNLETFVNVTKLNDDNIQDQGINASTKLADNSITGDKLAPAIVDDVTIELVSDVLRIKDDGVTTAKIADNSVTTDKIADLNVTNAKIADATIQRVKFANRSVNTDGTDPGSGGVSKSSSTGSFNTASLTYVDVTNGDTALTTNGRPVRLYLEPDGSGLSLLGGTAQTGGPGTPKVDISIKIIRDSTDIAEFNLQLNQAALGDIQYWPCGGVSFVDDVTSGTYTYKIQAKNNQSGVATGFSADVQNIRLVAYEL